MKEKENVNLVDVKKRLDDYLHVLYVKKIINKQSDISSSGVASSATVSKAINGKKGSLTKSFINKLIKEFGENEFTVDYIWNGSKIPNESIDYNVSNTEYIAKDKDSMTIEQLNKSIDELKKENEELSEKINDTLALIELYLAPIAATSNIKIDTDKKNQLLRHLS